MADKTTVKLGLAVTFVLTAIALYFVYKGAYSHEQEQKILINVSLGNVQSGGNNSLDGENEKSMKVKYVAASHKKENHLNQNANGICPPGYVPFEGVCCPIGYTARLCGQYCCRDEGSCCGSTCPCPPSHPSCMADKGFDGLCCPASADSQICGEYCCENSGKCCGSGCPCASEETCTEKEQKCCPEQKPIWCGNKEEGQCCDKEENCCGGKCLSGNQYCCGGEPVNPDNEPMVMDEFGERPRFIGVIEEEFKKQCAAFHQFAEQPTTQLHLAHVMSWKSLDELTQSYINGKEWANMQMLVKVVFEIDSQAGVWVGPKTNPKTFVSHTTYMGGELVKYNDKFTTQSSCLITSLEKNQGNPDSREAWKNELRKYIFNAPANLRYGIGPLNSGIRQNLDPMGNNQEWLTAKEIQWLIYGAGTTAVKDGTVCKQCSSSCVNAIRSSSASMDGVNYYVCRGKSQEEKNEL